MFLKQNIDDEIVTQNFTAIEYDGLLDKGSPLLKQANWWTSFLINNHNLLRMSIFEYLGTTILSYVMISGGSDDFKIHITILLACLLTVRQSGSHFHAGVTLMAMFRPTIRQDIFSGIIQIISALLGMVTGSLLSQALRGYMSPPFLPDYQQATLIRHFLLDTWASAAYQIFNLFLMEPKTCPSNDLLTNQILNTSVIYPCRKLGLEAGGNLNVSMTLGYFISWGLVTGDLSWIWSWDCIIRGSASLTGCLISFILFYKFIYYRDFSFVLQTFRL